MGAPSPPGTPRRISIFRSGHEGYGDARSIAAEGDSVATIRHFGGARLYSYHRVGYGVDMRNQGEIREGFGQKAYSGTLATNPPIYAVEWEDTVPNPLVYYVVDNLIRQFNALGAATAVTLTTTATGACMHDNGSGVPYLLTCYGGPAASSKIQYTNRALVTAASTNLYADKMLSISGDLYISVTPTNGTANCSIGKFAAGLNIASDNFPSLTRVGHAGRNINNIVAVRYAPVCLKPEGIFSYDRNSDTWINHARWLENFPHADNGKVYWYEGTDLIVALGAGGAVKFDGYIVTPYEFLPIDGSTPNTDTTPQQLAAAGAMKQWGIMVTKMCAKGQRMGGGDVFGSSRATAPLQFLKTTDNEGSFTSYTTEVTDNDATTYAVLSALDTAANGDYFYVGHVQPFTAVYFDILNANTNASILVRVQFWDGAAWTTVHSCNDFTAKNANGVPFARSGWNLLTQQGDAYALGFSDVVKDNTWTPSSINTLTRYWLRFSVSAVLSTPVRIKSIDVLPYRPSGDATNLPHDSADRAGVLPHILMSREIGGQHIVHDMGGLLYPDEIGAVLYANVSGPVGTIPLNADRNLFLFGKEFIHTIIMSPDDRPALYSWPISPFAMLTTVTCYVELAGIDLATSAKITSFIIRGRDFRRRGRIYYRFDDGAPWRTAGEFLSTPAFITVSNDDSGRILHVMVAWTTDANEAYLPISPLISSIDGDVVDVPDEMGDLPPIFAAPVV